MRTFNLRHIAAFGALSLLSACSGGDGGNPVQPQPFHVSFVKVSGDGQRRAVNAFDRVPEHVGLRLAVGFDSLFPLPLVGKLVMTGSLADRATTAARLDATSANLVVQWNASDPQCAHAFLVSTLPAVDSTVTNRGVVGTKAGTCWIKAVTLVGTEPMAVDSFSLTVDPGPPSPTWDSGSSAITYADSVVVGTSFTGKPALADEFGNRIDFTIGAPADSTVPLRVVGKVVYFTGTRDEQGRWLDQGGHNGEWDLPLLSTETGAPEGGLHVTVGSGQAAMWWEAKGVSVP